MTNVGLGDACSSYNYLWRFESVAACMILFHPLHRGLKVFLHAQYSFYPLQMERLFGLFMPMDILRYQKPITG